MYKKKPYTKKVNAAYYLAKKLNRNYKPEFKKYDVGSSSYNVGTTHQVNLLTQIAQGDTVSTRNANRILLRSLYIQGYVQHNNTATLGQMCKIYIVKDKQQIGDTTPTSSDMFTTGDVNAFINPDTAGRFSIIASRKIYVDPSNEFKPFKIYKKLSLPITYNGVNNTDIQKNGLYIFLVSSDNTNKPVITYNARLSFNDN